MSSSARRGERPGELAWHDRSSRKLVLLIYNVISTHDIGRPQRASMSGVRKARLCLLSDYRTERAVMAVRPCEKMPNRQGMARPAAFACLATAQSGLETWKRYSNVAMMLCDMASRVPATVVAGLEWINGFEGLEGSGDNRDWRSPLTKGVASLIAADADLGRKRMAWTVEAMRLRSKRQKAHGSRWPALPLKGKDSRTTSGQRRFTLGCDHAGLHDSRAPHRSGKARPVRQNTVDIALRLGDRRNQSAAHSAGAGIIGCKRQMRITEAVELLAKISGAAAQIIFRKEAIDSERCGRSGHQLRQAKGIFGREYIWLIPAFLNDHRIEKPDRNAIFAGDLRHQSKIICAPSFSGRPQKPGRSVGRDTTFQGTSHRRAGSGRQAAHPCRYGNIGYRRHKGQLRTSQVVIVASLGRETACHLSRNPKPARNMGAQDIAPIRPWWFWAGRRVRERVGVGYHGDKLDLSPVRLRMSCNLRRRDTCRREPGHPDQNPTHIHRSLSYPRQWK